MTQPDVSTSDLFARTAIASWKINLDRVNKLFDACSDEELQQAIAPGKNRIFYLLGHLAAVHDRMLPLLGLGARLHEELDHDFLTNPDTVGPDRVSAAALRQAYARINSTLTQAMEGLSAEAWLHRHEAVSAEDFSKEPLRNRLAVLLSRTAHVQFHTGQIRLAVRG
jgi:DinB superfamily